MVRTNLTRHCKDIHNKPRKALKEKEEPSAPKYVNLKEWVTNPAKVTPFQIPRCFLKPKGLDIPENPK